MGKKKSVRTRFTAASVQAVNLGETIYDERVPNLGLRVSPKGRRTFFVLGGAGERTTIGAFPKVSLEVGASSSWCLKAASTRLC